MIWRFLLPSSHPAMKPILKAIVTEVHETGVKFSKGRASTIMRWTTLFCISSDYGIWETIDTSPAVLNHYTCIVLLT